MFVPITGYNNYEVNEDGVVVRRSSNGKCSYVKATLDSNKRYKIVTLWKGNHRKTFMLHNLVAENLGIPVDVVKRHLYEGYSINNLKAKENVKSWVRSKLCECCEDKDVFHDEILYLKKILTVLD